VRLHFIYTNFGTAKGINQLLYIYIDIDINGSQNVIIKLQNIQPWVSLQWSTKNWSTV